MNNYFDNKGNYINVENLTLTQIYNQGFQKGMEKALNYGGQIVPDNLQGWKYEERPHGEWIKWNFKTFGALGDWEYKCSNCEKVYCGEYNFCPNCGADMRKGKGNE